MPSGFQSKIISKLDLHTKANAHQLLLKDFRHQVYKKFISHEYYSWLMFLEETSETIKGGGLMTQTDNVRNYLIAFFLIRLQEALYLLPIMN